MSEAKRRKDSKKAALSKCWAEDIDWDLIPHALREVSFLSNFYLKLCCQFCLALILLRYCFALRLSGSLWKCNYSSTL